MGTWVQVPWRPEGGVRASERQKMVFTAECSFFYLVPPFFDMFHTQIMRFCRSQLISVSICEACPSSMCHCSFDLWKTNVLVLMGVIHLLGRNLGAFSVQGCGRVLCLQCLKRFGFRLDKADIPTGTKQQSSQYLYNYNKGKRYKGNTQLQGCVIQGKLT